MTSPLVSFNDSKLRFGQLVVVMETFSHVK